MCGSPTCGNTPLCQRPGQSVKGHGNTDASSLARTPGGAQPRLQGSPVATASGWPALPLPPPPPALPISKITQKAGAEDCAESGSTTCSESMASEPLTFHDFHEDKERPTCMLQVVVERECRFFRISSSTLHTINSGRRKRPTPEGVTKGLRVFVHGLPAVKRARWQHPMNWCVAKVLQRVGCEAFIRRGELFAPLDAGNSGEIVRLDFVTERF